MTLHGEPLGAKLSQILYCGQDLLPALADDFRSAVAATPEAVSQITARTGGVGSDPGQRFDELLDVVTGILNVSESSVRDVGQALVWCADAYAKADDVARAEMQRRMKELERTA